MSDSILISTKKILGVDAEYTAFDLDIMTHINSIFTTLAQLGIGPSDGYMIEDDQPTWIDYFGEDTNLNSIKTYVYLRVRLLFDPPTTSYHLSSVQEQIKELEWRLSAYREATGWTKPVGTTPVFDGGGAIQ